MGKRLVNYSEEQVIVLQEVMPISKRFIDLTGLKYSELEVITFHKRFNKHSYWFCKCSCGNIVSVSANSLNAGTSKMCTDCSNILFSEKNKPRKDVLIGEFSVILPHKQRVTKIGNNRSAKVYVYCSGCDTEVYAPYDISLNRGYIPCLCGDSKTPFRNWTPELRNRQINQICKSRKYSVISYPNTHKISDRTKLQCLMCGTEWESSVGNFCNGGYGCPTCGRAKTEKGLKKSLEYYINTYPTEGYNYEKANYIRCTDHIEIVCSRHGSFFQSPDNHFRGGRGCPSCTKGGFNKMKAGYLYILSVSEDVIKFGITNHTTEKRMSEIQSKTKENIKFLYEKYFDCGRRLYEKEQRLMKLFDTGVISKDRLPSGYTETTYKDNLALIIAELEENDE